MVTRILVMFKNSLSKMLRISKILGLLKIRIAANIAAILLFIKPNGLDRIRMHSVTDNLNIKDKEMKTTKTQRSQGQRNSLCPLCLCGFLYGIYSCISALHLKLLFVVLTLDGVVLEMKQK